MTNYIGRDIDRISNVEVLDNITFDGSQSYTLQKGGVNFTPNSAQSIILGIDGITQIGNFSVNGSTIDFGVAVANTSTCNYIIHLGTGLLTAPSDGSVTNAKLGTAPTLEAKGSGGTAGGVKYFCEAGTHGVTIRSPAHANYSGSYELKLPTAQGSANTFLKNDGSGNLSFASAGGSNTPFFLANLSSNQSVTSNAVTKINFNNEIADPNGVYDHTSNYRFTPASAGYYMVNINLLYTPLGQDLHGATLRLYINGSFEALGGGIFENYDINANSNQSLRINQLVYFDSNDYAEVYAQFNFHPSTSSCNVQSGTGNNESIGSTFSAFKIIE
jgi:hypothetical protein